MLYQLSYIGGAMNLTLAHCRGRVLSQPSKPNQGLDPAMRARLLQESRTPWRSLRRALWFALLASAGLGLFTMAFRLSAGETVDFSDLGIQAGALILFSSLVLFDRNRSAD